MASPARAHINEITGEVVNSAMKVHSVLGPGLLESAYQACLAHELRNRGLQVATQVALPVVYEGHRLEVGYRIDLVVEGTRSRGSKVSRRDPTPSTKRSFFPTCA